MELGLFGKEKLSSFWQILADIGLRSHTVATDRKQLVQCPAPRMKPNTLKMPLTMKVTVDMMACVIE